MLTRPSTLKKDFARIQSAYGFFSSTMHDDSYWRRCYRSDFGPIPSLDIILNPDIRYRYIAKDMYIAESMFRAAKHARADLRSILFTELTEFLAGPEFPEFTWNENNLHCFRIYHKLIDFYNQNDLIKKKQSFVKLLNFYITTSDYRACIAILEILYAEEHIHYHFVSLFDQLTQIHKEKLFHDFQIINEYYDCNEINDDSLTLLTAFCYRNNIGSLDKEKSNTYLHILIAENNIRAFKDLIFSNMKGSPSILSASWSILESNHNYSDQICALALYELYKYKRNLYELHSQRIIESKRANVIYELSNLVQNQDFKDELFKLARMLGSQQALTDTTHEASRKKHSDLAPNELMELFQDKPSHMFFERLTTIHSAVDVWLLQVAVQLNKINIGAFHQPCFGGLMHSTKQPLLKGMLLCAKANILLWNEIKNNDFCRIDAQELFIEALSYDSEVVEAYLAAGVSHNIIPAKVADIMRKEIKLLLQSHFQKNADLAIEESTEETTVKLKRG